MVSVDRAIESAVKGNQALAVAYGLLGRILSAELDKDLLGRLMQKEVRANLQVLGISTRELSEQSTETLAIDYCQTFLGPQGNVSLLQSVAETGLLDGPARQSMNRYLECIAVPIRHGQMVDHLGIQLLAMSAILSDDSESNPGSELAVEFFRTHVKWGSRICEQGTRIAKTEFYRGVLVATQELIDVGIE